MLSLKIVELTPPASETVEEGVEERSESEVVPESNAEIVITEQEVSIPSTSTIDSDTAVTIGDYDTEDFTEYFDEDEEEVVEEVKNNNPQATPGVPIVAIPFKVKHELIDLCESDDEDFLEEQVMLQQFRELKRKLQSSDNGGNAKKQKNSITVHSTKKSKGS